MFILLHDGLNPLDHIMVGIDAIKYVVPIGGKTIICCKDGNELHVFETVAAVHAAAGGLPPPPPAPAKVIL